MRTRWDNDVILRQLGCLWKGLAWHWPAGHACGLLHAVRRFEIAPVQVPSDLGPDAESQFAGRPRDGVQCHIAGSTVYGPADMMRLSNTPLGGAASSP
jgi:hypothetical protein